jgi:cytochrome c oxidase subunit 2
MTDEQRSGAVEASMHIDPYERNWIRISIVLLVVFAAAVTIAGFALGFQVPSPEARVDPQTVTIGDGAFADPGLRELAPGVYQAYIVAQTFAFNPAEITVPAGSEVTFYVTSVDVQHGFKIQNTNVNMQIVPGQVSTLTMTFDEPGTYDYICTEYCGISHQLMYGSVIVEP